jgi:hypothetical protein
MPFRPFGCYLGQEIQTQLMQWVNADYEQTELEIRGLSQDELEFVLVSPETEAEDWIGETNLEPDQGEELAELKETQSLESDGEKLDG